MANFTITGNGITATGVENIPSGRTTSGPTLAVITTVLGWMIDNANQIVEFQGTFSPSSAVEIYKNGITLYGGAYDPFTNTGIHAIWNASGGASSAIIDWRSKNVIDGFEFSAFTGNVIMPTNDPAASGTTIQNNRFHDNTGLTFCIYLMNHGYNNVLGNCFILNGSGIGTSSGAICPHNLIIGNEFSGFGALGGTHAIYLGGGAGGNQSSQGWNEVASNYFHDALSGAALHVKCQHNLIHGNRFENMTINASVPISLYSELSGYLANDNDIYDNTFVNCYYGLWIGRGDPTLRNKIHDNTFTKVTYPFRLNGSGSPTQDTKIYYNDFRNCPNLFEPTGQDKTLIRNTVVAYNYFDTTVSSSSLAELNSWTVYPAMVYHNTFFPPNTMLAMPDSNYTLVRDPTSPYYIPPRTATAKGKLEIHGFLDANEVIAKVEIVGIGLYDTPFIIDLDPQTYTINCLYQGQTQTKTANIISDQTTRVDFTFQVTSINFTVTSEANGSVSPSGALILTIGQQYPFLATPTAIYQLDHWDLGGANIGSNNPITITATEDMNNKTLTALFTLIPPAQITLNIVITGKGVTTPTGGSQTFNVGDAIQFTAIPNVGYSFTQWKLDSMTYTDNPLTFTITEAMNDKTLTAEFTGPTPITSSMLLPALGLLIVVGIGYLATRKKR